MRMASRIDLRHGDEQILRRVAAALCGDARLASRARIVLLAAEGLANTEIAARTGVSAATVRHWRNRYADGGVDALQDMPRSGRPRSVGEAAIVLTALSPPQQAGLTRWTCAAVARELGVSLETVSRTWRRWNLRCLRRGWFQLPTLPPLDPQLIEIAGMYEGPQGNAFVAQHAWHPRGLALRGTGHSPWPGQAPITGPPSSPPAAVRGGELVRFISEVAAAWPTSALYVIGDDSSMRVCQAIRPWLSLNPRVRFRGIKAGCSWLAVAEVFLSMNKGKGPNPSPGQGNGPACKTAHPINDLPAVIRLEWPWPPERHMPPDPVE